MWVTTSPCGSRESVTASPCRSHKSVTSSPRGNRESVTTSPCGSRESVTASPHGSRESVLKHVKYQCCYTVYRCCQRQKQWLLLWRMKWMSQTSWIYRICFYTSAMFNVWSFKPITVNNILLVRNSFIQTIMHSDCSTHAHQSIFHHANLIDVSTVQYQ